VSAYRGAFRKTRRSTERRDRLAGRVIIAERPPEALGRAVSGLGEGDLITGAESKSAIETLVERCNGYVMLLHLSNSHGADVVQGAMVEAVTRLPQTLRRTLTWDQRREMANHAAIAKATELEIYFCDPHSARQPPTNEEHERTAAPVLPKCTDLCGYHREYLEFVAAQLNNRPRKPLGWHTPAEALDQLLSDPDNPPGVALTR
jgi:IS30 family transposase